MMAHRLLQHYLDGGKAPLAGDFDLRCKQSSLMEKRAAEAERASIKYKQVEFMMEHIGEVFEGVVSGLTGWGLYVEIGETKSEGQVSLKSITRDRFEFDADKYIIRGMRTREEIHLGDKVMVKVVAGDLNKRTLDFQLV
jgi:ribonuclease R